MFALPSFELHCLQAQGSAVVCCFGFCFAFGESLSRNCGPSHSLHALLYQRCHNNRAPIVSAPDSEPLATTCSSGRLIIRIKLRTKPCCRCRTVRSQMNRRRALHHALTDECWTPASLPPPRLRLTSLLQPLVFAVQGQSLLACTHKKCFSIHQASPPCKGMTMHLHHAQ